MIHKKTKNGDEDDDENDDDKDSISMNAVSLLVEDWSSTNNNWLSIKNQKIIRWVMIVSLLLVVTFWAACFLPYNNIALLTTYRTVISSKECKQLIQAAEDYVATTTGSTAGTAGNNNASNIGEGNGNNITNNDKDDNGDGDGDGEWLTERHNYYATTDLSLFSIPTATLLWNSKIRDKVLPLVAAQYGFLVDDLELADLFIVKYTGGGIDGQQDSLDLHMDGSMISFNVALSEYNDNDGSIIDFNDSNSNSNYYSGGGTYFPLLNNTSNKTTTRTLPLLRIHQGDMLVHDSGLLHAGAQTISGNRYLLVGFVNLLSWKNMPYYLQYRHFGTTATCVNVSTIVAGKKYNNNNRAAQSTCSSNNDIRCDEQKKDNNENNEDEVKNGNDVYGNDTNEIVCPGTRTARKILIQHYTKSFINFDNPDDSTSLPNPLLIYGVIVHVFILLRVLYIMFRPTTAPPKIK